MNIVFFIQRIGRYDSACYGFHYFTIGDYTILGIHQANLAIIYYLLVTRGLNRFP